jgi:hypothetical protein
MLITFWGLLHCAIGNWGSPTKRRMIDDSETIWKQARPWSSGICMEGLRKKPRNTWVKIAGVPTEIRNENLTNTSIEQYRYTNPLRVVNLLVQVTWNNGRTWRDGVEKCSMRSLTLSRGGSDVACCRTPRVLRSDAVISIYLSFISSFFVFPS